MIKLQGNKLILSHKKDPNAVTLDSDGIVDPHKNEKRYLNWKGKQLQELKEKDLKFFQLFLRDFEMGINIDPWHKGKRSYTRLNTLKYRVPTFCKWVYSEFDKPLVDLTEDEALTLFHFLDSGKICKSNGQKFRSYSDYVKDFKTFWHWYMKYNKKLHKTSGGKDGAIIEDITKDLGKNIKELPTFNYFTYDQLQLLIRGATKSKYKVMMEFLFDSGCRAPKEMMNIKVSDLEDIPDSKNGFVTIRNEVSKTFQRKIKLMFCYPRLKQYIADSQLGPNDFIFTGAPNKVNQYLKRLGYRVLGIGIPKKIKTSSHGQKIEEETYEGGLTMYDFRHSSACYWLPLYPTENALKYRFGWKQSEKIEYYTRFLGMKDTIDEAHLIDMETKTKLEGDLETEKKKRELLEEQIKAMNLMMVEKFAEVEKKLVDQGYGELKEQAVDIAVKQIKRK